MKTTTAFCTLSKHISQGQIGYLMTKIFLEKNYFLTEFLSFSLIFNSEKSPPVEYLVKVE